MRAEDFPQAGGAPDPRIVQGRTAPEEILDELVDPGERVIHTGRDKANGLDKCPRCASSDIGYSPTDQALVCRYCRFEWNEEIAETAFGFDSPIEQLQGITRGSGTHVIADSSSTVTIKCQGCGAEVVIRAEETLQARCHWCRQVLSINTQIPNGAVPDAILPFSLTHEQGVQAVREFASARRFFATRAFREQFTPENVLGVYMPYMLVDGNLSARIEGVGERTLRTYQKRINKDTTITVHDVQVSKIGRQFDFTVDDLIAESNSSRAHLDTAVNTNNVLNAILPFDTKNAVAYNANYLGGFSSEKRDMEIDDIDDSVLENFLSIARSRADRMIPAYDRGVRWEREGLQVHGTRWVSLYLPVWLYSYRDPKSSMIHYIAVNGRSGRTMGSIPVSHPRLFAVAAVAGILTASVTLPFALGGAFV